MKNFQIAVLLILTSFSNIYTQDIWEKTSGPDATTIYSLATNSDGVVFAGTDEVGVFRSTDNGNTWTNQGIENYEIRAIVIDSNGDILVATNPWGGIFRSTDNGNNWTNLGLPHFDMSLAINSSGEIFVGTGAVGLWRTTNNGANWDQVLFGENSSGINAISVNSSGDIFAGTIQGGVFRSTDNGISWTQIIQGMTALQVLSLAINSSNHIFAGTSGGGVFRSTDNGDNWVEINQGIAGQGLYIYSLAINSSGYIFAGTADGVFQSTDNGANWIQINQGLTNINVHSLAINSNGDVFAGTEAGIFRTIQSTNIANITLTPSSQTVYLNQPASVTVGIEGVENLFAVSITLSFNNSIIKCSSITQGNFLAGNSGGYNVLFETFPEDLNSASTIIVDQAILGLATVSGTGNLFTITFDPSAGGTSQIEVTSFSLRDINNQEIPATFESAVINVNPINAAMITLTPSTQTVTNNDPVSIQVGVDGVVGLFAVSVTLSFDNSIIKCTGITEGNFLAGNGGGYDVFFETFPEDLYSASSVTVDQSILGLATVSGSGNIFTITFEPFAGGTSVIEVTEFSLRDINNQELPSFAETAEITVNASVVNSKIFLQGPYNTGAGSMLTILNSSALLPLTQPYSGVPWNYLGSESVAAGFFSTHPDIVDWVLVELRTGTSAGTTVARRAAFLKSDGSIVDINGLGPVRFFGLAAAGYYIVVKHRNHLAIMSSGSVSISGITPLYNFTDLQTKAYGTNAMMDLGGVYGMYTADTDGSGVVNATDRSNTWNDRNLLGYYGTDVDLSGVVNAGDRSTVWNNRNMQTQVP